jgi:hypothetical protein
MEHLGSTKRMNCLIITHIQSMYDPYLKHLNIVKRVPTHNSTQSDRKHTLLSVAKENDRQNKEKQNIENFGDNNWIQ